MAREVTVTFILDEDVTPFLFAEKVANGCARSGVIREGEAVLGAGAAFLRTADITLEVGVVGKNEVVTPGIQLIPLLRSNSVEEVRGYMNLYKGE